MHSFKITLLAGASALLATAAFSAPASAATIYSGGSSLISPYLAQAYGCHVGSSGISNPAVSTDHALRILTPGPLATIAACPVTDAHPDTTNFYDYLQSSSSGGIGGFYSQDGTKLGTYPTGVSTFPSVTLGASDAALTSTEISIYSNGGTDSVTGLSFAASGVAPTAGQYASPFDTFGALIQIPLSIDPIGLVYNPNYTGGTFNIQAPGGLQLDRTTVCKIFNGEITNWNDAALTNLNTPDGNPAHGVSLTGGTSVAIHLVGRSDGSGTTDIVTRHLATVCGGVVTTNHYVDPQGTTTIPSGISSIFSLQSGSGGVASTVNSTNGALGYIGADWTASYHTASGATSLVLPAAVLINHNNSTAYAVSPANALTAFGTVTPPSGSAQAIQANWVPTTGIADPASGYPIIGTTNALLGTKYPTATYNALANNTRTTEGFLTWYYNTTGSDTVLNNAGLAALPSAWKSSIFGAFVTGNAQNLQLVATP